MKNELTVFNNPEFGKIRTLVINDEVWFVGKDVATALGYSNTKDALAKHVDPEDKRQDDGVAICDPMGREQHPTIINESGVYSLGLSSKLPGAKRFRRWVTSEVLPSIRKTGSYTHKEHPMTNYQKMMAEKWERDHALQEARFYAGMAKRYRGTNYEQVLNAYATKSLSGEYLVPLPQMGEQMLTAGEVGERLGISANMVGRLAKQYNLKTDQYGEWFHDKSRYSDKQVPSFRYKTCVVDKLREVLNTETVE